MPDIPTDSFPSSEPPRPEEGALVGRYRLLHALGRGGMGEVYLAEDTLLHRKVALKRVRADRSAPKDDKRMLAEARQAALINHPGVAAVHDVFVSDDSVVIVMEYVKGRTLRDALRGAIDIERFWDVALQLVNAVAAAHARGVIHRDLKPENVMLTDEGRVKVLDFGIAKRLFVDEDPEALTTETIDHRLDGTPSYMAPELLLGRKIDVRVDIFSLGVFFYEMLSGRRPFDARSRAETLNRILGGEREPLASRRPDLPAALVEVIEQMIARERSGRFPNIDALRSALESARGGEPPTTRESTTTALSPRAIPPRRASGTHRGRLASAALLACVALAFVGYRLWRSAGDARLPAVPHVAVLRIAASERDAEDGYLLGVTDAVADRLDRATVTHPFQVAAPGDVLDEEVTAPEEARSRLGANVVLNTAIAANAGRFTGRMALLDAETGSTIATRSIETDESSLPLVSALTTAAFELLGVPPPRESAAEYFGTEGAGSLFAYLVGQGALRNRHTETARDKFTLALDIDRRFALAYVGRGWCDYRDYLESEDPALLDEAVAAAREAIALDKSCADAYRLLGYSWSRGGQPDSAVVALEQAVSLNPADYTAFREWGRVFGRRGDVENEERVYRLAVAAQPHSWRPMWSLAALLYNRGRFDEARAAFESMVARAPDHYRGHAYLGGLYVYEGRYEDAARALERSIALYPTEAAVSNLGTAYFNHYEFEAAIRTYNQAFQYGFDDYMLWINLGDAYHWSVDRQQEALPAYLRAIEAGRAELDARPYDIWILGDLAPVYARIGETDSARVVLARALDGNEENPNLQYNAALTLWEMSSPDSAMLWLRRSVQGGFPVRWLRDSPVFQSWREEPEFLELIEARADTGSATVSKGEL